MKSVVDTALQHTNEAQAYVLACLEHTMCYDVLRPEYALVACLFGLEVARDS
jgi:hypothetical protein